MCWKDPEKKQNWEIGLEMLIDEPDQMLVLMFGSDFVLQQLTWHPLMRRR